MAHFPKWPPSFIVPQALHIPTNKQPLPTMSLGNSVVPGLTSSLPNYDLHRFLALRQLMLSQDPSTSVPTPQQLFNTIQQIQRAPCTSDFQPPRYGIYQPSVCVPTTPSTSSLHHSTSIHNGDCQSAVQDLSAQRNHVTSPRSGTTTAAAPTAATLSSPSTNSSPSDPNLTLPSDLGNESIQAPHHLLDFSPNRSSFPINANQPVIGFPQSGIANESLKPENNVTGQDVDNTLNEIQRNYYIAFYHRLFSYVLSNFQSKNYLAADSNLTQKTEPLSLGQLGGSQQNGVHANSAMPVHEPLHGDLSFGGSSTAVPPKPESLSDNPSTDHSTDPSPGSVNGVYACKLCHKSYSQSSALKMHVRTHTLPCRCSHCGKSFSRKWLLKGHERTHTGERPYACTVCNRSFADRSNLRAHLQTHQRDKRYACRHCPRSFSRMGLLNKHMTQCVGVGRPVQSGNVAILPDSKSAVRREAPLVLCKPDYPPPSAFVSKGISGPRD